MVSRSKKTPTGSDQRQGKSEEKKTRTRRVSSVSAKSKKHEPEEEEMEKRTRQEKKSGRQEGYEMGAAEFDPEYSGKTASDEESEIPVRRKKTYPSKRKETEKKEFGGGRGYDPSTYQGGERDYRKGGSWYGTGFNEGYEVGFGEEGSKDYGSQHGTYHASPQGGEWDQDYGYQQKPIQRSRQGYGREYGQERSQQYGQQYGQGRRQGYDQGYGHVYGPDYSQERGTGYNFQGDWGIGSEYHEHPYRGEFTTGQRRGYGTSYQGWPEQGWPEQGGYGPRPEGYERERSFYGHHRRHYYPEGYQEGITQYGQSYPGGYEPRQESEGYYGPERRRGQEREDYGQYYENRGRVSKKFRDQGRRDQL